MWSPAIFIALLAPAQTYAGGGGGGLPVDKVHGVNLGSWLLLEPWMLPQEWVRMGGETCFMNGGSCLNCVASEFDLVKKIGQEKADEVFQRHWETWFSESDVRDIAGAGLNTVRIPLGYWIIEPLVDCKTEFYARGGIKQLKRGVQQLRDAGIHVLLDFHAMPGVSAAHTMFAGHCTTDVEFYTPPNYLRALQWAAVMTFITHVDSSFDSVFGIEAVNEPVMDPTMTPGYGDYLTDFTLVVRGVELALGIICPGVDYLSLFGLGDSSTGGASLANSTEPLPSGNRNASAFANGSSAQPSAGGAPTLPLLASAHGGRVGDVLTSIIPMLESVAAELDVPNPLSTSPSSNSSRRSWRGERHESKLLNGANRQCLHTTFMDVLWQQNKGFNPAGATEGPSLFDHHEYFSFGGVADPNPDSYLTTICNSHQVKNDTDLHNVPLVFGEWALSTNFNATDEFLTQWADAQKLVYSQSSGWIFWSFKIEEGSSNQREWDYFTALKAEHFTRNPESLNDPHVCDPYRITGQ